MLDFYISGFICIQLEGLLKTGYGSFTVVVSLGGGLCPQVRGL